MKSCIPFKVLLRKEVREIVRAPRSFFIAFFFFSIAAFLFLASDYWFVANSASFAFFFLNLPFIAVLIVPLLTMNVRSREQNLYTDRLLASMPASIEAIVYARFFSRALFLLVLLCLTMIIPLSVMYLGNLSFGVLVISYVGIALFCMALLALSLLIASRFKSPAVNFLASFIVLALLAFIRVPVESSLPHFMEMLFNSLSFIQRIDLWLKGIADTRTPVFFSAIIVVALESEVFLLKKAQY